MGFGVFFNTAIVKQKEIHSLPEKVVSLGNWCLTPVRCIFNGDQVIIDKDHRNHTTITHKKEHGKRSLDQIIIAIVLILPGLISGAVIKGLGHLSREIRELHKIAVTHYTPINMITIGDKENRLHFDAIRQKLSEYPNFLQQTVNTVLIYAKEGMEMPRDPGFLDLLPQRVILVGATISKEFQLQQLPKKWSIITLPTRTIIKLEAIHDNLEKVLDRPLSKTKELYQIIKSEEDKDFEEQKKKQKEEEELLDFLQSLKNGKENYKEELVEEEEIGTWNPEDRKENNPKDFFDF